MGIATLLSARDGQAFKTALKRRKIYRGRGLTGYRNIQ
jgi:hypothetical protein